jgi:hypothetical protein
MAYLADANCYNLVIQICQSGQTSQNSRFEFNRTTFYWFSNSHLVKKNLLHLKIRLQKYYLLNVFIVSMKKKVITLSFLYLSHSR